MAKLRVIGLTPLEKEINFVSHSDLSKIDARPFFRPQTKNAYIIADGNLLEGK